MTRHLHRIALLCATLALAALTGCTSTPQADRDRDAMAKEFLTHPGHSTLYVYRRPSDSQFDDSVLFIDGRLVGSTLPGGYFRVNLEPGRHRLHGMASDAGTLSLDTLSGELYFISLALVGGHSHFEEIPVKTGISELTGCCVLLENWAPGQRPLLY